MEYTTPAASYSRKRKNPRTYLFFKRWTDICVSLLLLLLLSPLLLFICWHLYKKEGKPLFYRELAAGKGEKPFIKLSFRTMTTRHESFVHFLPILSLHLGKRGCRTSLPFSGIKNRR